MNPVPKTSKQKKPACFGKYAPPEVCAVCIHWEECVEEYMRRYICRPPRGGKEWKP